MRVFLTGGAGFIGSHVCEQLLLEGHEVVVFDNMSTGSNRIEGATIISGDIRNSEEVFTAMQDCTHVAHLAALSSVPASVSNPDLSGEINTEGNIHIDGIMRGIIRANEVVIGPNGEFDGEIIADTLIINGNFTSQTSNTIFNS